MNKKDIREVTFEYEDRYDFETPFKFTQQGTDLYMRVKFEDVVLDNEDLEYEIDNWQVYQFLKDGYESDTFVGCKVVSYEVLKWETAEYMPLNSEKGIRLFATVKALVEVDFDYGDMLLQILDDVGEEEYEDDKVLLERFKEIFINQYKDIVEEGSDAKKMYDFLIMETNECLLKEDRERANNIFFSFEDFLGLVR